MFHRFYPSRTKTKRGIQRAQTIGITRGQYKTLTVEMREAKEERKKIETLKINDLNNLT